jgi:uridine phosphorylase
VTVLSTGMGTDNIEIVLNELHALIDCDNETKAWAPSAPTSPPVRLIRVGTCGSPHSDANVGDLAITSHVLGMDNTAYYYERPPLTGADAELQCAIDGTALGRTTRPYAGHADPEMVSRLRLAVAGVNPQRRALVGATASGSGFYGCQGRQTGRLRLGVPTLLADLAGVRVARAGPDGSDLRVVNIEMECSSLCVLSALLGYRATAVCAIVATRVGEKRTFAAPDVVAAALDDAIRAALNAVVLP